MNVVSPSPDSLNSDSLVKFKDYLKFNPKAETSEDHNIPLAKLHVSFYDNSLHKLVVPFTPVLIRYTLLRNSEGQYDHGDHTLWSSHQIGPSVKSRSLHLKTAKASSKDAFIDCTNRPSRSLNIELKYVVSNAVVPLQVDDSCKMLHLKQSFK
uniref:Uncharacterized protein n=1 Tax=Glossina pallidipes TaxID=7398 RepID=A0A1A9ZEU4_GLOPL